VKRTTAILGLFTAHLALSAQPPKTTPVIAPPPRLLREINLNQIIRERAGFLPSTHSVRTLAISPDEKWIAVAVGVHRREGKFKRIDTPFESHLLIVPLNGPPSQTVQLEPRALLGEGSLAWSPNSDALVVEGLFAQSAKLYNVRGDELWKSDHPRLGGLLPQWIVGFLDPGHLLAYHISAKGKAAGFDTLDPQGRVIDTWSAPKNWTSAAINPDRRLFAAFSGDLRIKLLIIDYASKKVVQSESNATWLYRDGNRSVGAAWYFAEAGKSICAVGNVKSREMHAQCWDIDSGQTIAEYRRFLEGAPAAASAHGSRLVLTQSWFLPSGRGSETFSGGRVIWDFRSGTEIAAWEPGTQAVETASDVPRIIQPAPVAISSTGRYVAEAAEGILRIYEMP
jgi:WD40 repeat protein